MKVAKSIGGDGVAPMVGPPGSMGVHATECLSLEMHVIEIKLGTMVAGPSSISALVLDVGAKSPDSPIARRSTRSNAMGAVKEAATKLIPAKRKKRCEKIGPTVINPHCPLCSLSQQLLVEWGRACGLSLLDDVANEVMQTLLEL